MRRALAPSAQDRLRSAQACLGRGDFVGAERILRDITGTEPDNGDAWFLLGAIALQSNRTSDGAAYLARAVELSPNHPIYLTNLGEAQRRLNQIEPAITNLQRAISLNPDLAPARFNLGLALRARGRLREGLAAMQQAVQATPEIDVNAQLSDALCVHGQYEQAATHARRLLAKRPSAAVHVALGNALHEMAAFQEAIAHFQQAILLEPHRVWAHIGQGRSLCYQGYVNEGMDCLRRAAELDPSCAMPHLLMSESLVWSGLIAEAVERAKRAVELSPLPATHSHLMYALTFDPACDEATMLAEARRYSARFEQPLVAKRRALSRNLDADRRLRIGYVSSGFRQKVDSHFTVPLLAHHDHEHFEVFCYSYARLTDSTTDKHRAYADGWRDVASQTDDEVADQINQDAIDILVELGMHTPDGHPTLIALKPAPIQICWLAYPGTTGLQAMDYRITDPYSDPPDRREHYYSERNLWLPNSFWCYDPLTSEPEVNELPALRNGHITFASFNRFGKVNHAVLALWARVLDAIKDSCLSIFVSPGVRKARVYQPFDQLGVARERIRFVPAEFKREFYLMHHDVDIVLDPFPCNGGTTSLDALWMGVPVISRVGQTVVGRIGCSLLSNLGLPELLATTPEQYLEIAVELSNNVGRLAELRRGLRQRLQQSPLMDAPRFARDMESLYRKAWHEYCAAAR